MNTLPLSGQVAQVTQALTTVRAAAAVLSRHRDGSEAGSRTAEGTRRDGELGPAVVFLASDAPSFMTGGVTVMDGGYSLF